MFRKPPVYEAIDPNPKQPRQVMKKILLPAILISGLMTANASVFMYSVSMNGLNEAPPNASPGTGGGVIAYDDVARTLSINVNFTGLLGNTTAAHIHGPTASPFTGTAGVVLTPGTLPGFPLGVTSGTYATVLDLSLSSTYPAAYITANGGTTIGAETAITGAMAAGRTYFNIHSTVVPGGEIRGFLTAVPEPSSLAMLGLGAMALAARSRKSICK